MILFFFIAIITNPPSHLKENNYHLSLSRGWKSLYEVRLGHIYHCLPRAQDSAWQIRLLLIVYQMSEWCSHPKCKAALTSMRKYKLDIFDFGALHVRWNYFLW
jgi:hypothetical protein